MTRHPMPWPTRLLTVLTALILTCGTLIAATPKAQAAPNVPVRIQNMDNTTVVTLACQDVLFIAVRGSSETTAQNGGKGIPVNYAWEDFLSRMGTLSQAENVTTRIGLWAVNYPAASVGVAVTDPVGYFGSIGQGTESIVSTLQARERRCGTGQFHEKVVLVGYSQGAMVIHRAILAINNDQTRSLVGNAATRQAIAGSLLIADGDRTSGDGATLLGTAWGPLPVSGIGQDSAYGIDPVGLWMRLPEKASGYGLADISTPNPSVATPTAPSWSVCRALDPVCDYGNFAPTVSLAGAVGGPPGIEAAVLTAAAVVEAHMTAYQNNQDVGRDVTAAAQNLANTVYPQLFPPLAIMGDPTDITLQQPYSYQLRIKTAPGTTATWTAQNLPTGLGIDSRTGLISGTPTARVNAPATVQVRESGTNRGTTRVFPIFSQATGYSTPVAFDCSIPSPYGSIRMGTFSGSISFSLPGQVSAGARINSAILRIDLKPSATARNNMIALGWQTVSGSYTLSISGAGLNTPSNTPYTVAFPMSVPSQGVSGDGDLLWHSAGFSNSITAPTSPDTWYLSAKRLTGTLTGVTADGESGAYPFVCTPPTSTFNPPFAMLNVT